MSLSDPCYCSSRTGGRRAQLLYLAAPAQAVDMVGAGIAAAFCGKNGATDMAAHINICQESSVRSVWSSLAATSVILVLIK